MYLALGGGIQSSGVNVFINKIWSFAARFPLNDIVTVFQNSNICDLRTRCIRQGFWPPLKPKIESYFTSFSLDCFIR